MNDKFDGPLLGILQSCGELEPFLDTVLGFLYRKTDFFLPLSEDQTMGFSQGAAQAKLLKVFKRYEKLREATLMPRSPAANIPRSPQQLRQQQPLTPPVTPGNSSASEVATVQQPTASAPPQPAANIKVEKVEEIQGDWSTANWDHHNGGFTQKYAWSQTAQDVELKVALPNPNIKAKDLKIDIKAHSLNVQLKTEEGLRSILEEKLHSIVKPEESMWSLHKGECLQVNLEKGRDGYWWTGMFEDGNVVALDSIDTTRHMSEFGQEEQVTVQKLMFDQHQKMKGEPTSDELVTEEILKKAWDADDSPFQGTPYDRSKINLSNAPAPMGQTFGT